MKPAFIYAATVERIIDADTLDVVIDAGFRITVSLPLRLAHVDAPERFTPDGKAATVFVGEFLGPLPVDVVVQTYKPADKYGRYLATVSCHDIDLGSALIDAGHAVPYEGGPRL